VSDPHHPIETGYYDIPGYAYGVAVAGIYAYVAYGDFGLRVINVSNPRNLIEVGHYYTPSVAYGVAAAGSYVYVVDEEAGLRVIDVRDPHNPSESGYYYTFALAYGVAVAGSYAYVATGNGGVQVIEFYGSGVEEDSITQVNEQIATVVGGMLKLGADAQSAGLFDITGRKVLDLKPGANDVRGVKPGVYFIKGIRSNKVIISR